MGLFGQLRLLDRSFGRAQVEFYHRAEFARAASQSGSWPLVASSARLGLFTRRLSPTSCPSIVTQSSGPKFLRLEQRRPIRRLSLLRLESKCLVCAFVQLPWDMRKHPDNEQPSPSPSIVECPKVAVTSAQSGVLIIAEPATTQASTPASTHVSWSAICKLYYLYCCAIRRQVLLNQSVTNRP